ncbi:MAG TPA: hypothetical protein P5102_18350 [Candidatus Competibacteraceae bacterium]|nr:hypothetical protein [Candidatus Competibacteraceae bacterium]
MYTAKNITIKRRLSNKKIMIAADAAGASFLELASVNHQILMN